MTTTITSNGGGNPEPIKKLFERLATETLDPWFEKYGNFIEIDPANELGKRLYRAGTSQFWGNFYTVSAVFSVATRDAELTAKLTAAIRANQETQAYAEAKRERIASDLASEERRIAKDAARQAERMASARNTLRAGGSV